MNAGAWAAIRPLLLVAAGAVAVLLAAAIRRSRAAPVALTFVTLGLAALALGPAYTAAPQQLGALLVVDGYALVYVTALLIIAALVALLSLGEPRASLYFAEEYFALLLLAVAGGCILACSSHFATFFLGLELLSVSLFALIPYERHRREGLEAGLKYIVMAGVSSGFLLFGMALVYAELGTMSLAGVAARLAGAPGGQMLTAVGLAMMAAGVGFKLAWFPFHWWSPDVYQGGPTPVVGFVATASKVAVFAVFLRYTVGLQIGRQVAAAGSLTALAVASMFAGNLLGLAQTNLRRMMGYSSVAHMGYALVPVLAGGARGAAAATYYLVVYSLTMLGVFGSLALLAGEKAEGGELRDLQGLAWRRPWPAAALTIGLLSLAGIPLTAGFLGKFYALMAATDAQLWLLIGALVASSAIGLVFYLRAVQAIFDRAEGPAPEAAGGAAPPRPALPRAVAVALVTLLVVLLGAWPQPVVALISALGAPGG